ncbi:MAG: hypothetical protein K9W43_06630 [Candidatus Thorarchaeota archaeon]|nr:hypothetical protein [Candidatus Thorarchaeota archaeon]
MRIDDYEFEEEKTLRNLAELLTRIAEQVAQGSELELPMPSLRDGIITLPLGEPVETGIEVAFRKEYIHLRIDLSWTRPTTEVKKE